MTYQDYAQYVSDWNTFNRIWAINYYLSSSGMKNRYSFSSYREKNQYMNGQAAHIDVYSSNSPGRILSTINVPSNLLAPDNQFDTID